MSNYLLVLGANQFQRERGLIGAEKAFSGPVLTTSPEAKFNANKYPLHFISCTETDPQDTLKAVIEYEKRTSRKPVAVVPLNDFVLNSGYAVANHYGCIYNSKETIDNCRDKYLLKMRLHQSNLPVELGYRFQTLAEGVKVAEGIGYPVVLKPLNFGGSGGVVKIESPTDFATSFEATRSHVKTYASKYNSNDSEFVLEKYIVTKSEVSVEVLNFKGARRLIGITQKFLGPEPFFSEIGHFVPSPLHQNESILSAIQVLAFAACEALNIEFGMAHVEMKIPDPTSQPGASPILIEVGCRTAGDGILDLYERTSEINIYALHCQAFLGTLDIDSVNVDFKHSAAISYLHPNAGVLEKIDLRFVDGNTHPNIDRLICKTQIGQTIVPARDWSTRYGFIEWFWPNAPFCQSNFIEDSKFIANNILLVR